METLLSLTAERAMNHAHAVALCSREETVTYAKLWNRILGFAGYACLLLSEKGRLLSVEAVPPVDFAVASLGIQLAGGICVLNEEGRSEAAARIDCAEICSVAEGFYSADASFYPPAETDPALLHITRNGKTVYTHGELLEAVRTDASLPFLSVYRALIKTV